MTFEAAPPRTVAVTGVNGFVGRHLAAELAANDITVVGIGHEKASTHASVSEYVEADLAQAWPRLPPVDAVIHLAGLSAVGPSFEDPQRYISGNSSMVTVLAEAMLAAGGGFRVLLVSSGAVYDAHQSQPLTEESRVGHSSPYVVSKLVVEAQAAYYQRRGLDIVVARPFNHIGPGQGPGFLVPDLVRSMREAVRSGSAVVVGDLETRRDYTDVRDVARAYRLLLQADLGDERLFNVCSGTSRTGREILRLIGIAEGLSDVPTMVDPSRIRPDDPRDICGDSSRLVRLTGWRPEIPLATSIEDYVTASRG